MIFDSVLPDVQDRQRSLLETIAFLAGAIIPIQLVTLPFGYSQYLRGETEKQEAINDETPILVISQSVMELFKFRENQSEAYRAIEFMRHGFGNHPFGEDEKIAEERQTSRIERI